MANDRRYEDEEDDGPSVILILLLLALLLALAFFGWRWLQGRNDDPPPPPPVEETRARDRAPAARPERAPEPAPEPEIEPEIEPQTEFEPEPIPQPIPEPAPAAPREDARLTVYFELMKSTLTPEAEAALARFWRDAATDEVESLRIEGFTDTAGAVSYNDPLSARRAERVRAFFAAQGVSAARMETASYGEAPARLARRTADGVREPLNRRAEIVIRFR